MVKEIDTSNGVGGTFATTYAYGGAKNDLSGRGFLGYQQVIATDHQTGVVETTSRDAEMHLTEALVPGSVDTIQVFDPANGAITTTPSDRIQRCDIERLRRKPLRRRYPI